MQMASFQGGNFNDDEALILPTGEGRSSINEDLESDSVDLYPSPIVAQNDEAALRNRARLKKGFGIVVTTVIAGVLWAIPILDSKPTAHRCLALLIWTSILWTTELLPIWVTSLCIPVLVVVMEILPPVTGDYNAKTAASIVMGQMMGESVLLAFAAFTMSLAFTKYQLSQRLVSLYLDPHVLMSLIPNYCNRL
jgi:hypothetical protein